jgi:hypothetical protein
MRALRHRALVPLAAVAASTALFACHRGDSILLIEVAGDERLAPASFEVSVQPAQAAQRTFRVAPKNGSTVTLPTSLSVEMAPDLTGPVTVIVSAYDVSGLSLASGTATQTDINVGGETIVVVMLTSNSLPPPFDAGTDAVSGTGGSGLDASGVGGVGGTGVAGSGGAAGGGMAGRGGSAGGAGSAGNVGTTGSGGAAGSGGKAGTSGAGGSTGTGGLGGSGGAPGSGGAGGMGGRGTGGSGTGGAGSSGTDAGQVTDAGGDR